MVEKASPFLAPTFLEGTLDIARRSLAGHIFALIIILFTLAEPYLNLDPPLFEIGGKRNQRVALLLRQSIKAANLPFVH